MAPPAGAEVKMLVDDGSGRLAELDRLNGLDWRRYPFLNALPPAGRLYGLDAGVAADMERWFANFATTAAIKSRCSTDCGKVSEPKSAIKASWAPSKAHGS